MSLDNFKQGATVLMMTALIIGALVIALDAFQDDIESTSRICQGHAQSVWNATSGRCENTSLNTQALGFTSWDYNITQEGLLGTSNATSYLSTIGTLIGVAALIAVVIGAFMFVRR